MSIKYFIVSVALLSFCAAGLRAQEFALSTNFADYAEFGTLNVEASYGVARHWSLSVAVKYNPFTYSRRDELLQHKQRSLSAGVRYWPWHIYSGWRLSAAVRYQEYNSGGIISPETREGGHPGGHPAPAPGLEACPPQAGPGHPGGTPADIPDARRKE